MSTFLNSYADSIPMGYSPAQALDVITGHLTANGWQVIGFGCRCAGRCHQPAVWNRMAADDKTLP